MKLVLVGCGSKKQSKRCRAADMYTGPLFRASRRYAEQSGTPWLILSAWHGVIDPQQQIDPYDRRMGQGDKHERNALRFRISSGIRIALSDLNTPTTKNDAGHMVWAEPIEIEVHAGKAYVDAVREAYPTATITAPLEGLQIGDRLAWYKQHSKPRSTYDQRFPPDTTPKKRCTKCGETRRRFIADGNGVPRCDRRVDDGFCGGSEFEPAPVSWNGTPINSNRSSGEQLQLF